MRTEKIKALMDVVVGEVENMEEVEIDTIMEVDGEEYLVLTEDEAETRFHEQERELIEELGLSAFNEWASNYIMDNFLDRDYFDEILRESMENYIEGIKDEEGRLEEEMEEVGVENEEDYIDYLILNAGDSIQYYKNNFGDDGLQDLINRNESILDIDGIIEYIEEVDGRGGLLASYDGQEHEVKVDGEYFYIYRVN